MIPSKWDVIPIHASDISAFKRCRRYWDWTSPTRTNLRRKVQIFGVNTDLWFGTGIHYALEMYYNPLIKRDPVEAWTTWFEIQWNGGIVDESWLERCYDPDPVPMQIPSSALGQEFLEISYKGGKVIKEPVGEKNIRWRVQGLNTLLPDPDHDEFMQFRDLGIGMMEFYKAYAAKNDDFIVISAESPFSVPLGFKWVDKREDSPNYGKKLEVHARGKRDAIIQNVHSEQYGIIDHKTKSKIDEIYRESLQKDEQCTNYMHFSQEEAKLFDLPYETISFVVHNALRKAYPRSPTITTRGLPSLNRNEESTTPELFEKCVKELGVGVWAENDEKAKSYYEYLVKAGDLQFIERTNVFRNKYELKAQGEHVKQVAKEMLDSPAVYPNPTGNYLCVNCQFRGPCIAKDDGSDYIAMLTDGYESNVGR